MTLKILNSKSKSKSRKLKKKSPFIKGICLKIKIKKPKKPNSANRKIAKLKLSNNIITNALIPGVGRNLNQHSIVLIKHSKIRDLPGIKYKIVRNKYDCLPVLNRKTSRSKYGKSKID